MLYRTPPLVSIDREVLVEVAAMRHELREVVQRVPVRLVDNIRRSLTASAIAASNTIEGYRVDPVDAADLLDGEREAVDASERNKKETLAFQQTMTYIQSLWDVDDFEYSKGLLNALHWMLQGHHHPRYPAGRWRKKPIFITTAGDPHATEYEGPDEGDVPHLMDELVSWLNQGDLEADPLVRAAMAHLNLVKIHPWIDGNGRMSRSLQTLLIARAGVVAPEFSSIEEWLGLPGNTWEYYSVLREVGGPVYSPKRETLPWVRFNLRAYHEQSQRVRHRVQRSTDCWIALADHADRLHLAERQITALHDVAISGRVRRSRYEKAEALSNQQAVRDIQALTKAALLTLPWVVSASET